MSTKNFCDDVNNYYGIKSIEQITNLISETGLDVDSACLQFGLNNEQVNIVKLIYARDFYVLSHYDRGDQYLKQVEKSQDKTPFVKTLFEEVTKNKRFYKSRDVEAKGTLASKLITICNNKD